MSQFAFLQREWSAVFDAAARAEAAVQADPRTACFYGRARLRSKAVDHRVRCDLTRVRVEACGKAASRSSFKRPIITNL